MDTSIAKQDNTEFMKDYLRDLYEIHKKDYSLKLTADKYSNISKHTGISRVGQNNSPKRRNAFNNQPILYGEETPYEGGSVVKWGIVLGIIASVLMFVASGGEFSIVFYAFPIGFAIGAAICWLCNASDRKKVREDKRAAEAERIEDEKRVKAEKEKWDNFYEPLFLETISTLGAVQSTIDDMYDAYDIIFPKYRNMCAISQIYEYFASGRCTELEGPDGAYNLYESELRQNIIIGKLEEIQSQLNRIEHNQYMIYSAIQEGNRILRQIENNTEIMAFNSAAIAYNTEMIAKYGLQSNN